MWSKIKSWFGWIAGAVIGFLLLLLGMKNKKIKKQKEEIKDLETESAVKDVEIKTTQTAQKAENENAQRIVESQVKTEETIEEVKQGSTSYNDLIKGWNDEENN